MVLSAGRPDHVVEEVAGQVDPGERVTRVQNDETSKALGRLPEGVEPCLIEVGAVDGGSDLHTGHAQLPHREVQLLRGSSRVLQRDCP